MSSFRSLMVRNANRTRHFMLPILLPILGARTYALQQHLPGKKAFAPLAQLAEQLTLNQRVAGSIPARCILRVALVSEMTL
jgi:hypothetical protein